MDTLWIHLQFSHTLSGVCVCFQTFITISLQTKPNMEGILYQGLLRIEPRLILRENGYVWNDKNEVTMTVVIVWVC